MSPRYYTRKQYTIVATPHFLKQLNRRQDIVPGRWSTSFADFDTLVQKSPRDTQCGVEFDTCILYYRYTYNRKRGRNELELKTVTPCDRFHTRRHDDTVKVEI